jgi:hypothetical protein
MIHRVDINNDDDDDLYTHLLQLFDTLAELRTLVFEEFDLLRRSFLIFHVAVPPEIAASPKREALDVRDGIENGRIVGVEGIDVLLHVAVEVTPQADGAALEVVILPLLLTVEQKRTESAAVEMIHDSHEELFIELKAAGELLHDVIHTVQELHKDRRFFIRVPIEMPTPV